METIDEIDRLLIRYIQENPRESFVAISRATGIPETTVRRRLNALFEAQVIRQVVTPDVYALGYEASALVGLRVEMHCHMDVAARLRDMPEVTFVATTLGRFDVMFFIVQPSVLALSTFLSEQVASIPGVQYSETLVAPRVFKILADWLVPLAGMDPVAASNTQAGGHE